MTSFQNTPARRYILACDVGVSSGAEYGAGAGVGIEEGEVFRSKYKTPIGILQLLGAIEEERKRTLPGDWGGLHRSESEDRTYSAVDTWEYFLARFSKVIKTDQGTSIY